jgi:hypothetical protein
LKKIQKFVCIEAGKLKFCMIMLYFDGFKAYFSDFEVSDICGRFLQYVES